jgi:hypothetical protein
LLTEIPGTRDLELGEQVPVTPHGARDDGGIFNQESHALPAYDISFSAGRVAKIEGNVEEQVLIGDSR